MFEIEIIRDIKGEKVREKQYTEYKQDARGLATVAAARTDVKAVYIRTYDYVAHIIGGCWNANHVIGKFDVRHIPTGTVFHVTDHQGEIVASFAYGNPDMSSTAAREAAWHLCELLNKASGGE